MRKIFFYVENHERGGAILYLYELCELAMRDRATIVLVSNLKAISDEEKEWFTKIGINCRAIPILSWSELRKNVLLCRFFVFKLCLRCLYLLLCPLIWIYQLAIFVWIFATESPDLAVCAHGGYPAGGSGLRMLLISRLFRTPCILSVVSFPSSGLKDQIRMMFWDRALRSRISRVIVNAKKIKEALLRKGFKNIVVLYNGISGCVSYVPRHGSKVKILFFARMEKVKGIDTLIEAIDLLSSDVLQRIDLHFCGTGSQLNSVSTWAANKGFRPVVHGFVQSADFFRHFSNTNIYVLPSVLEGLPYTLIEAMRYGCAAIGTAVGGVPELIESGVTGMLVRPGDAVALAAAIKHLVLDRELCRKMGQAAKEKFDREFEQSKIYELRKDIFTI